MVTDDERDYMYLRVQRRIRRRGINLGIRRRLAPLVGNSRRRIELLNSLLFSFPGTPIIYYGDEIGMGDNVYLGDRNGVRTPMQWTGDRNAGFSRADPARLYSPVDHGSRLRLPGGERRGAGERRRVAAPLDAEHDPPAQAVQGLRPGDDGVPVSRPTARCWPTFAGTATTSILCVANLSRIVQPVELDLRAFAGMVPVEMLGYTEFPTIGATPYFLTLGPYGFYWFELQRSGS